MVRVLYRQFSIGQLRMTTIKEGKAEIKVPNDTGVFYNRVQEFNRDLSVLVLTVAAQQHVQKKQEKNAGESFRVLEALAATGLRSIRYAKEVPNIDELIANDISPKAVEIMERNIMDNNVGHIVKTSNLDAVEVMLKHRHYKNRFQVVDLDPYGSPVQFLDSAVQCVSDGGLLLVTCTDMAVLCGLTPQTCFARYGAVSLKNKSCHEMALRIALHCIQSHASRYKRYIVPVLSISVDFYVRLVVRIFTSAAKCREITSRTAMFYQCTGCYSTHFQPLGVIQKNVESKNEIYSVPSAPVVNMACFHCNGKQKMGGPIWSAPMQDLNFVRELILAAENCELNTKSRLLGVLTMILEELYDVPLFYDLPKTCSVFGCKTIPMMVMRSAILNGGYRVSYSHTNRNSVKTDAPATFFWDILRKWIRDNYPEGLNNRKSEVASNILKKSMENEIDFSLRPDANPLSRKNNLVRFQENPEPCWGPGTRSSLNLKKDREDKSVKNQGKKRKKAAEENEEQMKKVLVNSEVEGNS